MLTYHAQQLFMTLGSGSNSDQNSAAVAHIAEQPAYRKFTLADALILIAGLAIVLSMGAHLLNNPKDNRTRALLAKR
jgi:hypothetical protein